MAAVDWFRRIFPLLRMFDLLTQMVAPATSSAAAWYCVRTLAKHERVAAAHLRGRAGLEVCFPRLRYKRATVRGAVWRTEAMFPGYVFARFSLAVAARFVIHLPGVRGIVHFGRSWPSVPEGVIEDLRAGAGPDQVHTIPDTIEVGSRVIISGGALDGMRGLVTRLVPSRQRVEVLLDFLGRQTAAEVPGESVVAEVRSVG